jgi:hypothetical protein
VGTPIRPLPDSVARWAAWGRWLRWLDSLLAWLAVLAMLDTAMPPLSAGQAAVLGAALVVALTALAPLRARWRPASGGVGLVVSRRLRPGDLAWYVGQGQPQRVLVTARRRFRMVIAILNRGGAEAISVRRTRVLLVPAELDPARG